MRYSPVRHSSPGNAPEGLFPSLPFDLHVLGMPPAFNLSQDQTLQFIAFVPPPGRMTRSIPPQPRQMATYGDETNLDSMFTGFDAKSIPASTEMAAQVINLSAHTNILIRFFRERKPGEFPD